ncbi:UNVERIFIED_CONTAM: hypothetical protein Cloal_2205 [Acetivibrio alkalicellulosi]
MSVLALYDASGIQEYIFASGKLRENIGASNLVADVLKKILVSCIKKHCSKDKCLVEWEKAISSSLSKENEAEVIYIGGGNAMVYFDSEERARTITESFYKRLVKDTYRVKIISAFTKVTDSFTNDRIKLIRQIEREKNLQKPFNMLKGFSINRLDNISSLPWVVNKTDKGMYINPREKYLKLNAYRQEKDSDFIDEKYRDKFTFDGVFDNLGGDKGDNMLAVVHIDGNSMGAFIGEHMSKFDNYDGAVSEFRKISSQINTSYTNAYRDIISLLCDYLSNEKNIKLLKDKGVVIRRNNSGKHILPVRHLIFEGDDVTFVCNAKLAFFLVENFIKLLQPLSIDNKVMHACAGIAFVHSHFPFSIAYSLAEECCLNAKRQAKTMDNKNPLSWIDFHVNLGGITGSLDDIRKRWFEMPGYSLLRRPWLIDKDINNQTNYNEYSFNILKDYIKMFNEKTSSSNNKFSDSIWPRTKLKELRNAYLKGESAVTLYMAELVSRVYQKDEKYNSDKLDEWTDPMINIDAKKISRYFDAVESLDFFPIDELFSTNLSRG